MPRGRKTGGKDFKKGQSGNPNGRPRKTEEQKQAEELFKEIQKELKANKITAANQFFKDVIKNYQKSWSDLQQDLADKDVSVGERIIMKFMLKCIKDGGMGQLSLLMKMMSADEVKIDLTSSDYSMTPPENDISDEQLNKIAKAFIASNE
jgi:hypothetical protein